MRLNSGLFGECPPIAPCSLLRYPQISPDPLTLFTRPKLHFTSPLSTIRWTWPFDSIPINPCQESRHPVDPIFTESAMAGWRVVTSLFSTISVQTSPFRLENPRFRSIRRVSRRSVTLSRTYMPCSSSGPRLKVHPRRRFPKWPPGLPG